MSVIYGNIVGGNNTLGKSVIIACEDGTELVGVVVDKETVMTATPNDVRAGCVCATEDGIITGTKDIPAYRTTKGSKLIMAGQDFSIPLSLYDKYDYTKLQCIIAEYDNRVKSDRVVIDDIVYPVNSAEQISVVTKNSETKAIDLNITNDSDKNYVIHYFTYREEE